MSILGSLSGGGDGGDDSKGSGGGGEDSGDDDDGRGGGDGGGSQVSTNSLSAGRLQSRWLSALLPCIVHGDAALCHRCSCRLIRLGETTYHIAITDTDFREQLEPRSPR